MKKKKNLGRYWKTVTPLERLAHLNEWCKAGCPTIGKILLVEDPKQPTIKKEAHV